MTWKPLIFLFSFIFFYFVGPLPGQLFIYGFVVRLWTICVFKAFNVAHCVGSENATTSTLGKRASDGSEDGASPTKRQRTESSPGQEQTLKGDAQETPEMGEPFLGARPVNDPSVMASSGMAQTPLLNMPSPNGPSMPIPRDPEVHRSIITQPRLVEGEPGALIPTAGPPLPEVLSTHDHQPLPVVELASQPAEIISTLVENATHYTAGVAMGLVTAAAIENATTRAAGGAIRAAGPALGIAAGVAVMGSHIFSNVPEAGEALRSGIRNLNSAPQGAEIALPPGEGEGGSNDNINDPFLIPAANESVVWLDLVVGIGIQILTLLIFSILIVELRPAIKRWVKWRLSFSPFLVEFLCGCLDSKVIPTSLASRLFLSFFLFFILVYIKAFTHQF